ncbi:MAG: hypothetical protein ACYS8W_16090 [Planctomycetota bacterium]
MVSTEMLEQIVRDIVAANPSVFPPPFSVVVREGLFIESTSAVRSEAAAQVFREGKQQILSVNRRVLVEFSPRPKQSIIIHRGSLEKDDDVEPAILIADNPLLAAWRITEDLIHAAKSYERFRRRKKRKFRLGPRGNRLLDYNEFEAAVYDTIDRNPMLFPKWMLERLDRGIGVRRDSGSLDGRLVLGWFTHDQYGRGIEVFSGSFRELAGIDTDYETERDFEANILSVLVHEFVHHVGSLKGQDPIAKLEWSRAAFEREKLSPRARQTHGLILKLFILAAVCLAVIFLIIIIRSR